MTLSLDPHPMGSFRSVLVVLDGVGTPDAPHNAVTGIHANS